MPARPSDSPDEIEAGRGAPLETGGFQQGPTRDESERRFQLFVDSVQDYGIFMLDPEGTIVSWNRGAERIKGYTEAEAIGRHFSIFYGGEDRNAERPRRALETATREGRYQDEGWRYRKNGRRFWAHVTITAVRSEDGNLVGFGKVTRDLTERKEAEEGLRWAEEAARAAEAASQAKSDFLAAMSHELRTPLNAIIGYADLMASGVAGSVTTEQATHLARIRGASDHLLLQIDQILSLARIEAGREEVHPERVDAAETARAVLDMLEPVAERKGLSSRLELPDAPLHIRTDPAKLRQILLNLLSNAVKFTDKGEFGLRVQPDQAGGARFEVWDQGIGVAEQDRERIFERFTQADQTSTRRKGGTGLGLAISRDLAHLLGGEVAIESSGPAGSTFTLRLPA